MNIKAFMALAVVALTAACASEDPKAVEEVQGVTVEETAEASEAVTEEAAVATAVTDAVEAAEAAPEGEQAR
jgi:hypothetical protein